MRVGIVLVRMSQMPKTIEYERIAAITTIPANPASSLHQLGE